LCKSSECQSGKKCGIAKETEIIHVGQLLKGVQVALIIGEDFDIVS